MKQILRGLTYTLALTALASLEGAAQNENIPKPDEYSVYEAVLGLMDNIPVQNLHATIFGMTLNTKCGEDAAYLPLANGCSFLWIKPDTPNNVKRLLHRQWSGFEDSTWSDFENKNASSARLHEPIATPWKHELVFPGDTPSKDAESPNFTVFLSRVGFNQSKNEAVVYVLLFSYMDQLATAGDYFLFRMDKIGHWEPEGRVTYFSRGK